MTAPPVSIIVPCYNQGHYLKEALESLVPCDKTLFELIIVNDGSTEPATNEYLRSLASQGFCIIDQSNQGLSGARNTGILRSQGRYILLLDCDNKIRPDYLVKGIAALDADDRAAVVYGNARYFGEKAGPWKVGPFNMQRLMLGNFIDACAMVRRSVVESLGFYDTQMRIGWEDWDLWLRIAFAGYGFYHIDEELFDYRVTGTSMSRTLYNNYAKPNAIEDYIHRKYPTKMGHGWIVDTYVKRFRQSPFRWVTKLFIKAYFPEYYDKLLAKNKIRNGL